MAVADSARERRRANLARRGGGQAGGAAGPTAGPKLPTAVPPNIGETIGVLRGQLGGGLPTSALPGVLPTKPMPGVPGGGMQPITGGGLQAPLQPGQRLAVGRPAMPPGLMQKDGDGGPGAEQGGMRVLDLDARVNPATGAAEGRDPATNEFAPPGQVSRAGEMPGRWRGGDLPGRRMGQQPQVEVLQGEPPIPGAAMGGGPAVNPQAAQIAQRLQAMTGGGLQGGLVTDGNAGGWNPGAFGGGGQGNPDVAARRMALDQRLRALMQQYGGNFQSI